MITEPKPADPDPTESRRAHDLGLGRRDPRLPRLRPTLQRPHRRHQHLLQVLRRVAHGFTNVDNFAARGLLVT